MPLPSLLGDVMGSETPDLDKHFIVTVDAENPVTLVQGIETLSALRDRIEKAEDVKIPLVWFVRFQRSWDEYLGIESPEYFEGPVTDGFDGHQLAKPQLLALRDRGDEIGWHYHANNYVHRDDLSHELRIEILKTDLVACGRELCTRHPEFEIRSFRFGWFFVPDYGVFPSLHAAGIRVDASVNPERAEGTNVVRKMKSTYLVPITDQPRYLDGVCLVPFRRTFLIHDWNVVAHEVSWRSHNEAAAQAGRDRFTGLVAMARELRETGGTFVTYDRFGRH
jgi:hypothetical protein